MAYLGEQESTQGAPLGRLVHNGTSRGQGWSDLPGTEHEGGIPRRYDTYGSNRLTQCVIGVLRSRQGEALLRFRCLVSKESKVFGTAQRRLAHESKRLTSIEGLDEGDLLGARHDSVRNRMQDFLALGSGGGFPSRKGRGCRLCRSVYIDCASGGHLVDGRVV